MPLKPCRKVFWADVEERLDNPASQDCLTTLQLDECQTRAESHGDMAFVSEVANWSSSKRMPRSRKLKKAARVGVGLNEAGTTRHTLQSSKTVQRDL